MQFVWKYVDDLVGKGLEWWIIIKLLVLVSATLVSLALPLAILLSSLMTFGQLGENFELTALKAAGISLKRILLPIALFCVLLSVLAFYFSNYILPVANLKMRLLLFDITHKRPELNIRPGIFNYDLEGYVIKIGNKDSKGEWMQDVLIYDLTQRNGNDRVLTASKAQMKKNENEDVLELTLYNGKSYTTVSQRRNLQYKTYPMIRESFDKETIRFDLSAFKLNKSDESLFKRNFQMLSLNQLERAIDTLKLVMVNEQHGSLNTMFRSEFHSYLQHGVMKKTPLPQLISSVESTDSSSVFNEISPQTITIFPQNSKSAGFSIRNKANLLSNFNASDQARVKNASEQALRTAKSILEYSKEGYRIQKEIIRRHEIEWHRKFTLSFACILMFLIGAPLGAIVKKGGLGVPVIFSVVFFILYHMISITGEKLVRESITSTFNGMWLSSMILLPIGLFLAYQASTDSRLFELESYTRPFKKLFKR
jgi:lipopolysaccharide export system permease protein